MRENLFNSSLLTFRVLPIMFGIPWLLMHDLNLCLNLHMIFSICECVHVHACVHESLCDRVQISLFVRTPVTLD